MPYGTMEPYSRYSKPSLGGFFVFLEVRSKSQQPVIEYYALRDGYIIKPYYLKMSEGRDGSRDSFMTAPQLELPITQT